MRMPREGRGNTTESRVDESVDLARLNGVDVAPILGHAPAHEMGHVLLPYGSHTSQGIIWDRAQFQAMAKGLLTFTAQHTDLIRMRVRAVAIERWVRTEFDS